MSFDGVADVHERARPSYPATPFDRLFDALPKQPDVVEIGPGTGQATASLLERDARVTAVELWPQLAAALAEKFAGYERLVVVNSSFEDAPVPAGSFDAVVAATAYHWIGPRQQVERLSNCCGLRECSLCTAICSGPTRAHKWGSSDMRWDRCR